MGTADDPIAAGARGQIVVILGCPRSGTTLLQALLARWFGAAVAAESHFIPLFAAYASLWGDLAKPAKRRLLAEIVFEFMALRLTHGPRYDLARIAPHSLLATRSEIDNLVENSRDYGELVEAMLRSYAAIQSRPMAVEKTAYFHPVSMAVLANCLPSARFIHIVRDGRDVALSWRNTWFGPRTIAEAARLWRGHVEEYASWGRARPERYLQLHYEDLVRDEEEAIRGIGRFLGLESGRDHPDEPAGSFFAILGEKAHFSRVGGPVKARNTMQWRAGMTPHEQAVMEAVAGGTLTAMGYPLAAGPDATLSRIRTAHAIWSGRVVALLSPTHWRRRIMALLPLFLWAARVLPGAVRRVTRDSDR